jgi:TolA-binding protein
MSDDTPLEPLTDLPPGDDAEARAGELLRQVPEPAPFGPARARRTLAQIRDRARRPADRRRWWWAVALAPGMVAAIVLIVRLATPPVAPGRVLVLEGSAEERDGVVTMRNGRLIVQTGGAPTSVEVPGSTGAQIVVHARSRIEIRVVQSRVQVCAFEGSARVESHELGVHELTAGRALSAAGETAIEAVPPEPPSPQAALPPQDAPPSLPAEAPAPPPAASPQAIAPPPAVAAPPALAAATPRVAAPALAAPQAIAPRVAPPAPAVAATPAPRTGEPRSRPARATGIAPASVDPPPPAHGSAPIVDDEPTPAASREPAATPLPIAPPPQAAPVAATPAPATPAPAAPAPSALAIEAASFERAVLALRRDHDPAAALRAIDAHLAAHPRGLLHADAAVLHVEALLALGRRSDARAALDRLSLAGLPRARELSVVRGELRAEAGRCRDAERDLAGVRGDDELAERALVGLADCRARRGDDAGARAGLEDYLARFPNGRFAARAKKALEK